MSFIFTRLEIPDCIFVKSQAYQDRRGSFSEVYRKDIFEEQGIGPFVQENSSFSIKNVIRGIHFQAPPMEVGKLVSCPAGEIFDVAVDLRPNSPTFGKWAGVVLMGGDMLWVPPGFGHGFATLSEAAVVLYRQTQYYSKEHDRALRWNDPMVGIDWPAFLGKPVLSTKDATAPSLMELFG